MPWIAAIVSALVIALVWMGVARGRGRADARHEPEPSATPVLSRTLAPSVARSRGVRVDALPEPVSRPRRSGPRLATLPLYSGSVCATLTPVPVGLVARPSAHGRPRIYFQTS